MFFKSKSSFFSHQNCAWFLQKSVPFIARIQSTQPAGRLPVSVKMERSARRRLESITRHLLTLEIVTFPSPLSQNLLAAAEPVAANPSPVIIGGMVLDIHAKPCTHPAPGTTTPGRVQYVSGGVARNVAECMSKLGSKPFMISVLGLDMAGDSLLKYWESAGLATEGIRKLEGITTPVVLNIFDCNGDLTAGVASVEAVETFLTPDWIQQFRRNISSGSVLIVDANLHPQSLEVACRIAAESGIPVWFEPVSVTKSTRITSVIHFITCISPNENELIAMASALSSEEFCPVQQVATGRKRPSIEYLFQMLKPAMHVLLEKGIKLLIVTLGADGAFLCVSEELHLMKYRLKGSISSCFGNQLYELVNERCPSQQYASCTKSGLSCSHSHAFHFPALPSSVVNVTGAGDCLVGGILASMCTGLGILQSTAVGIAVAKAAVETETNVPAGYSLATLADEAQKVFLAAKPLVLD